MSQIMRNIALLFPILAAACAIHPIPDNVSSYSTFDIVNNIRCEIKSQIRMRVKEQMNRPEYDRRLGKIEPEDILDKYTQIEKIAPGFATKISKYRSLALVYSFEFDITENNSNSAAFDFELPFTNANVKIGAQSRANFTRHGKRSFTLADSFEDLFKLICPKDFEPPAVNVAHPMSGSIGAARLIDTYLNLSSTGGNANNKAGPFTDEITFTTEVGGSISPEVTLNAVPKTFRLTKASGAFGASRIDMHKVTIVIAFPVIDDRTAQSVPVSASRAAELRKESINIAAEELCIRRANSNSGGALIIAQQAPEYYCQNARLR